MLLDYRKIQQTHPLQASSSSHLLSTKHLGGRFTVYVAVVKSTRIEIVRILAPMYFASVDIVCINGKVASFGHRVFSKDYLIVGEILHSR